VVGEEGYVEPVDGSITVKVGMGVEAGPAVGEQPSRCEDAEVE